MRERERERRGSQAIFSPQSEHHNDNVVLGMELIQILHTSEVEFF